MYFIIPSPALSAVFPDHSDLNDNESGSTAMQSTWASGKGSGFRAGTQSIGVAGKQIVKY